MNLRILFGKEYLELFPFFSVSQDVSALLENQRHFRKYTNCLIQDYSPIKMDISFRGIWDLQTVPI